MAPAADAAKYAADLGVGTLLIRGLAPQPRLLWAVAIGAVLIALAIVSPVLGLVAVIYNAGLVIIATRDLALLPGRSGFQVRRTMPRHSHLGSAKRSLSWLRIQRRQV